MPKRFLMVTRCFENLSSGEKRAEGEEKERGHLCSQDSDY